MDHVLDPDRALALLATDCPLLPRFSSCTVRYMRYKRGVSLVAGVELGEERAPAMLMAVSDAATSKVAKVIEHAGGKSWSPRSQVAADASGRLLLAAARHDRDLPGVAAILDRRGRVGSRLPSAEPTVLRYLPARRWLAVTGGCGEQRVVRVLRDKAADRAATALVYLRSRGLPVPAIEAQDLPRGIIATAWVPGIALPGNRATGAQLAELGRVLSDLHAQPPGPLPAGPDHAADVRATARALNALVPGRAETVGAIARRIVDILPTAGPRVVCHGDLSSDQVIVGPDGALWLIDFDRVCLDHPASDLGSLAATRVLDRQFSGETQTPEDVLAPVLAGYRQAPPFLGEGVLNAFTAAAIFRRSVEPFRYGLSGWPDLVNHRLEVARRVVLPQAPTD